MSKKPIITMPKKTIDVDTFCSQINGVAAAPEVKNIPAAPTKQMTTFSFSEADRQKIQKLGVYLGQKTGRFNIPATKIMRTALHFVQANEEFLSKYLEINQR